MIGRPVVEWARSTIRTLEAFHWSNRFGVSTPRTAGVAWKLSGSSTTLPFGFAGIRP